MRRSMTLFICLFPIWVVAQPAPVFEASTQQVATGTAGAPFYISPRRLTGAGLLSTNQYFPFGSHVKTNEFLYVDGTGGSTNIQTTLNGQWWTNLQTGTLSVTNTATFTGGPASFIPTNAAPVSVNANVTGSLPFGVTNTLSGRAQPVIQYYFVDGASGTPIMTLSNETSGMKLRISAGPLASVTQTNFATLPITTTNVIWRLRDESTGSGASVGLLTNWLIGL